MEPSECLGLMGIEVNGRAERIERFEAPCPPLASVRPATRRRDPRLGEPSEALVGPEVLAPVATLVDEVLPFAVEDRGETELERRDLGFVPRSLVVVGETLRACSTGERTAIEIDHRQSTDGGGRRRGLFARSGQVGLPPDPGQLDRLEDRLEVLEFVADDQFDDVVTRRGRAGERLEGALADPLEIGEGVAGAEPGQSGAIAPRGERCVVDLGEFVLEQRSAGRFMDQPQVLERGDVTEVPGDR